MITKPAVLECTRCGKIFIGWKTDVRPKRAPTCLRCKAREAWDVLASTVAPKPKKQRAGGKRTRSGGRRTRSRSRA
jgi:hypothetical protein